MSKGYHVSVKLDVMTTNIESLGDLVDAGIRAGINRINNVGYSLRPEENAELEDKLLLSALENAKEKAKIVLDTLKYDVIGIKSITVDP